MALGCYRNGYKCRDYIVVEVVDSPRIIDRVIGHEEVNNGIDVKLAFLPPASSSHMSDMT